jgi:asparagine synthetase B (glutamine-hydrolysing)
MPGLIGLLGGGATRAEAAPLAMALALAPTAVVRLGGAGEMWLGHVSLGLPGDDGGVARRGRYLLAAAGHVPGLGDPARPLVERLLDLVAERGPEGLADLNGIVAACLVDEERETATLVNDRLGIARLYYRVAGRRLAIASRARLLAGGSELDGPAVGQVLQVGFPLGDRTLFPGVHLLPPASFATWDRGALRIRRTWEPPPPAPGPAHLDEAAEIMHAALAHAVPRALEPRLRTVLPLSGGLDSRALLGILRGHEPLCTLSYGHGHSRDRRYGLRLARIAGARPETLTLGPGYLARFAARGVYLTDGEAPLTAFHLMCMSGRLAAEPSLVLSGLLGEIYSGAHLARVRAREVHAPLAVRARALFERRYRIGFDDEELARLLQPGLRSEAEGAAYEAYMNTYTAADGAHAAAERAHLELRVHRFTAYQLTVLGATALVHAPFADHEVLAAGFAVPLKARHGQLAYRHYIASKFPDLARVPHTASGLPLAGPRPLLAVRRALEWTRWRGLRRLTRGRFIPHDYRAYAHYDDWIRGAARPFFADLLADREALGDLVDLGVVAELWQAHLDRKVDAHGKLAAVATLALLRRQLRAGRAGPPPLLAPAAQEIDA